MKIHLRQILPEGSFIEGEDACPIMGLEREEIRCAGPLKYSLNIGISEGALWANGALRQPLEMRCVNCLEKFVHEVRVPDFALHLPLGGPETVDLTPIIREDIMLNLPAHPHCDRDGGKQCPGPREAPSVKMPTEAKRKHDWGALDRLKIRK